MSSLLLPLMLGIFTAVITINQHNATKQQRIEDHKVAEQNRQLERQIAAERYRDDIFDAYIREIGQLLEKYKGSLILNQVPMILTRAKTLNIFRRLDPQRNIRIIRFLHESEQLSGIGEQCSLDLSTAELPNIDFRQLAIRGKQLYNISLANSGSFYDAKMPYTKFERTRCIAAHFDRANLSESTFYQVNAKNAFFNNAVLTHVTFSLTNLEKADFNGTEITYSQLERALSIRDALLPNGTRAHGTNLVNNGHADCNIPLHLAWMLTHGNITTMKTDTDFNNCHFIVQSNDVGATVLDAHMTSEVSIELIGKNQNGAILNKTILDTTENNTIMRLHEDMKELQVFIKFSADQNKTHNKNNWCDDIKLFIDYNTAEVESLRVPLQSTDIRSSAKWVQNGLTVAGGNGRGNKNFHLNNPVGLYIDDDQTLYITDQSNHRIVQWKWSATSGEVLVGGNGQGNGTNQLSNPRNVILDKERDSLIICDSGNRKVIRWSRRNDGIIETIISNISCQDLAMDEDGSLYVIDGERNEVRRYQREEPRETVVAGRNGKGNGSNQFSNPKYLFVDRDHSVYVSDHDNHRVLKWTKDAKEGIVVAGNQTQGNNYTQLSKPYGIVVDQLGTVYVADGGNHRIIRWFRGATEGNVIVGGNDMGGQSNQLRFPVDLSFDRHGNLYVVDNENHRVQKFNIESNP
ncbi:unnamed protein product [Adineta steineri]|uniref:Uncharacterized protein n=1 Tax=Adineta steineri TaxID=433720 RepID=A0A814MXJ2_9BILA|nr:unnamed protein product [Adineta steineri]CAF1082597.1 unnamed protein product [Adineta steineri]